MFPNLEVLRPSSAHSSELAAGPGRFAGQLGTPHPKSSMQGVAPSPSLDRCQALRPSKASFQVLGLLNPLLSRNKIKHLITPKMKDFSRFFLPSPIRNIFLLARPFIQPGPSRIGRSTNTQPGHPHLTQPRHRRRSQKNHWPFPHRASN